MKHEDASNQQDDNYVCSTKDEEIHLKMTEQPRIRHTIKAAIACSMVSISIKAILRSFSKNLNRFIVPY